MGSSSDNGNADNLLSSSLSFLKTRYADRQKMNVNVDKANMAIQFILPAVSKIYLYMFVYFDSTIAFGLISVPNLCK